MGLGCDAISRKVFYQATVVPCYVALLLMPKRYGAAGGFLAI